MLAKKFKIPSSVLKKKIFFPAFKGKYLTVKKSKNNLSYSRFSVIISRFYDQRSVYRHRLKRQIFSLIQNFSFKITAGYDIIIFISRSVTSQSDPAPLFSEIKNFIFNLK